MNQSFTKLFASILESTLWCEADHIRIVWIAMMAMADPKGQVTASIPGLANRARVTVDQAEEALRCFKSPDKYSRTPDNEGRRIADFPGGWQILNYQKYREIRNHETVKESKRKYINERRKREREQEKVVENSRTDTSTVEKSRPKKKQTASDAVVGPDEPGSGSRFAPPTPSSPSGATSEKTQTETQNHILEQLAALKASFDDPKPQPMSPDQLESRKNLLKSQSDAILGVQPETTMPIATPL